MKSGYLKPNSIGLILIVKNEEAFIEQCLNSTKGIFDQIVVVDTGSIDRTPEIIKEKFPKVELYFHPWEKNFSKARNQCLDYIKTMWVMYLDADEVISPGSGKKIRNIVNEINPRFPIILVNIYNKMRDGVEAYLYYPRIWRRIWRSKDLDIHFEGAVHNQLVYPMNIPVVKTDIDIAHFGYSLDPEAMAKKHQRSQELLEDQIKLDDTNYFAHLNLAQLLRARGDLFGTIYHAQKVLDTCDENDPNLKHAILMALDQQGTSYLQMGLDQECEKVCLKALKLKNDYLDPVVSLGSLFMIKGMYDRAEFWFQKYLEISRTYDERKDPTNLILNHLKSSFIVYYNLGYINYMRKNFFKAEQYFKKVLEVSHYRDVDVRLGEVAYLFGNFDVMENYYREAEKNLGESRNDVFEIAGDQALERGQYVLATTNYSLSNKDSAREKERITTFYFGEGLNF